MNLIYQYWDGKLQPGVTASVNAVKKYADRIGSEYIFEHNPRWQTNLGGYSTHYGAFKPIFEWGDKYENILFLDADVFPIEGLEENIFDHKNFDIGICTEPFQPKQRTITLGKITSERDELWAQRIKKLWDIDVPRTEENLIEVFNTGVVLYSSTGIEKFKSQFISFEEYVKGVSDLTSFYTCDQPYLHAMLFYKDLNLLQLDAGWNSYVHGTRDIHQPTRRLMDWRDENTKFVHCQFAGKYGLYEDLLHKIVNLPQDQWGWTWK
jgi:hypothetical protein